MMGQLFGSAFLTMCLGFQAQYNEACNRALDATSRQVGIRQQAEYVESRVNVVLDQEAHKRIGQKGMALIGAVGFGYKTAQEKKVAFKVPTLGICSSARGEIGVEQYTLNLNWNF